MFDINIYTASKELLDLFSSLNIKIDLIMETQTELAEKLKEATGQIKKIGSEVKVLQDALKNQPNLIQEVKDAFGELATELNIVDELNPDVPEEPPV